MLSTSERFGNQKPDALVAVEKLIWKALFKLADGSHHPIKVLKKLATQLPWGEIGKLTEDEIFWFATGKPCND